MGVWWKDPPTRTGDRVAELQQDQTFLAYGVTQLLHAIDHFKVKWIQIMGHA